MDGLFGFVDLCDMESRTCQFPYDSAECDRVVRHLREIDPPIDEHVIPRVPLQSIAPEDRLLAYHFLLRAIWFMLFREEPLRDEAMPYLVAFSTIAKIRFACIECDPEFDGLSVRVNVLNYTDINIVRGLFFGIALMTQKGSLH